MGAAHQQHWDIDFVAINWLDIPVALVSMVLVFAMFGSPSGAGSSLTLLAGTVSLALLGNAIVCGVISAPHDRYGARMVWVATLVVLIAAIIRFARHDEAREDSFSP
jgi:hypothetical protein